MSVLARVDDWMNPIAVKELRQAVRGKFVAVALVLSLVAQLLCVAGITIASSLGSGPPTPGPTSFAVLFSIVFSAALFFIPMYSGFRMAAERADANVDLLFITTIRPRTIVAGKVISIAALVALLFSASLPFLMFSYVLRGVSFVNIAFVVALAMFIVISHSIGALFIGCVPTSRPFKILLALGFFLGTLAMLFPMLAGVNELMRGGVFVFGLPRIWPAVVSILVTILAADVILLVLTTAIITPAAANRALPIRIMLAVLWLLSLGAAAWGGVRLRGTEVLQVWSVAQMALLTLVLLSATSERESWGPRVQRTVPANPFKRAVAFLFYSGAAGGTLFVLLMYAATIGAYYGVVAGFSLPRTSPAPMVRYLADAGLAMLGYAMSAVLLRRTALRRVPANRTWGLVLALFILLTVLPPLVILAKDAETSEWGMYVHVTTLFNPFPTSQRPEGWRTQRTVILGLWAGAMLLANAPWVAAQIRRFGERRPLPPLSLQEATE